MFAIDLKALLPKALPHAIVVVLLFMASSVLMSPVLFEGKSLSQGDIKTNIGMSKEARDIQKRDGELPQWTDSMFGGMPTIQITGSDIDTAPRAIWKAIRMAIPMEVATLFVAMLSAYVLGLCFGMSPWLALLVGVGFGLSSLNVLYLSAGHATKVRAIATMPGVLGGMVLAFRGKVWRGMGVAALFAALHLEANHVQMTYYLLFLLAATTVGAWVHGAVSGQLPRIMKATGLLLVGGLLAALPQTGQLAVTEQYSEFTTRGDRVVSSTSRSVDLNDQDDGLNRDYILEYSMGRGEWWSVLVPDVKGGNSPFYWGEQRFSGGAFYFGALAFALCLAWMVAGSHWIRWPLLAVSALAVVLSWRDATWLTDVFLNHVPLFNKFRDTKMMLVLLQMVIPLGAAMALWELTTTDVTKRWKWWVGGASATALILLGFVAMPEALFDFESSIRPDLAMEQMGKRATGQRLEIFRADVIRSLGFAVVALLFVLALVKRWTNPLWVVAGVAVMMTIDLVGVDRRYIGDQNFVSSFEKRFPFEPRQDDRMILEQEKQGIADFDGQFAQAKARWEDRLDTKLTRRYARVADAAAFEVLNANSHFRVLELSNPFNDARTSYFHKSLGGYHGAKLRRYQDFIESSLQPELTRALTSLSEGQFNLNPADYPGLCMMNTRYLIDARLPQPIPFAGGLGPAWMVDGVRFVSSAEEELASLGSLNPAREAVVHEEFREALEGGVKSPGTSSVSLVQYAPEGSTYEVSTANGGLMVLSEVHYPVGWTATVDGQEVPLVRANYLLNAIEVPAGRHEVQMRFEPAGMTSARVLSMAGSLLWVLLMGASLVLGRREVNKG